MSFSNPNQKEYDDWGKSQNGYVGGGNFDEDPNLK